MPRKLISSGSRFEAEVGYSRAVVDGDFIFMSGCTGYDYATMTISEDIVAQCEQTFRNI
jgi:enamine deaminase RidA (YjgF/YER057c/UK114 family)